MSEKVLGIIDVIRPAFGRTINEHLVFTPDRVIVARLSGGFGGMMFGAIGAGIEAVIQIHEAKKKAKEYLELISGAKGEVEKIPPPEVESKDLYEQLLHVYRTIYGGGRQSLELKIKSLIKQGFYQLSREEAIRKLAEKEELIAKPIRSLDDVLKADEHNYAIHNFEIEEVEFKKSWGTYNLHITTSKKKHKWGVMGLGINQTLLTPPEKKKYEEEVLSPLREGSRSERKKALEDLYRWGENRILRVAFPYIYGPSQL